MFKPEGSDARRRALPAQILLPVLLLAALAASSNPEAADSSAPTSGSPSSEKPRTEAAAPGAREATVGVAGRAKEMEEPSGAAFVARTEASGGSGYYEADTVLGVRYGTHERYERMVLDLGTGGEPAETVPKWTLTSPTGDGLLRLTLPSMSRTAVSDGGFGDVLLESFYLVHASDSGMFVDIFARKPFAYRVLELSDPARLVVDFEPARSPLKARPPAVGGDTVLVEPRAGARVGDPLTVSGYLRNFEASNSIALSDSQGRIVVRRTVLSNDWASTWGYFEATLDLPAFGGKGTLRVGTRSARDGNFEGVEVPEKGTDSPPGRSAPETPKIRRARLTLNRKFCAAKVKQK